MVYGSVMGSFAVEKFGLDRLRALKKPEITARARHFGQAQNDAVSAVIDVPKESAGPFLTDAGSKRR